MRYQDWHSLKVFEHKQEHPDVPLKWGELSWDQYTAETAPRLESKLVHLHAFYEPRSGGVIWRVVFQGNRVCYIAGRCRKATLTLDPSDEAKDALALALIEGNVIHGISNGGLTFCCSMPVLELPHTDRLTVQPELVTCNANTH